MIVNGELVEVSTTIDGGATSTAVEAGSVKDDGESVSVIFYH